MVWEKNNHLMFEWENMKSRAQKFFVNSSVTLNKLLCLYDPGSSALKCSQEYRPKSELVVSKTSKGYTSENHQ